MSVTEGLGIGKLSEGGGASPMYLAIVLHQGLLQDRLYEKRVTETFRSPDQMDRMCCMLPFTDSEVRTRYTCIFPLFFSQLITNWV
jgi:hypothetical protein